VAYIQVYVRTSKQKESSGIYLKRKMSGSNRTENMKLVEQQLL